VRLSPLGTSSTIGLLYQPWITDDDECEASGGMIGRGNRSTRRKLIPVPFCLPQIPRELTWARTRAAAVRSRGLTAWATARPLSDRTAAFLFSAEGRLFYPESRGSTLLCQTTRYRHIPRDRSLNTDRYQNAKSHISKEEGVYKLLFCRIWLSSRFCSGALVVFLTAPFFWSLLQINKTAVVTGCCGR
jgi:hypothetical protein